MADEKFSQFTTATSVDGTETLAGLKASDNAQFPITFFPITVKVSLSSAEILALDATPVTLIAAQGTGTFIRLHSVTMKLNYGTTTYTGGGLRIKYTSGGSFIITNSSYTNSSSIIFNPALSNNQIFTTSAENDSLVIDAASAVSVGNGTLDIYLTYSVISL